MCPNEVGRIQGNSSRAGISATRAQGRRYQKECLPLSTGHQNRQGRKHHSDSRETLFPCLKSFHHSSTPFAMNHVTKIPVGQVGRVHCPNPSLRWIRSRNSCNKSCWSVLHNRRLLWQQYRAMSKMVWHSMPNFVHPFPILNHPSIRGSQV
ncbi:hypothetical protein PanWU01x14_060200 [Parasponia andersonii]|uniref:Uncharacterized protein n=1 Tax=Parasponia andersonii TaxID=3476 RepID=A0A2P5DIQ6_PARAD|nr:hypothetical protein PanWU01x14_060200 [Parasponia andersonii]